MSTSALRFYDVHKRYGKTHALAGMSFEVKAGVVTGLIGPNGAGKTTTFSVATGAVQEDAGVVDVLGKGAFDPRVHGSVVSVLPQDCALSPYSNAKQLLGHYARLSGMTKREAQKETARLLELTSLTERAGSRVRELSHGMRRRLAVAQALIGTPKLILLDEPTGGLDPKLVASMRDILRSLRGKSAVLVSTHILSDVEDTCDEVIFVDRGRVTRSGALDDVTQRARLVTLRVSEEVSEEVLARARAKNISLTRTASLAYSYSLTEGQDASDALTALLGAGVRVVEVTMGEPLMDAYLKAQQE